MQDGILKTQNLATYSGNAFTRSFFSLNCLVASFLSRELEVQHLSTRTCLSGQVRSRAGPARTRAFHRPAAPLCRAAGSPGAARSPQPPRPVPPRSSAPHSARSPGPSGSGPRGETRPGRGFARAVPPPFIASPYAPGSGRGPPPSPLRAASRAGQTSGREPRTGQGGERRPAAALRRPQAAPALRARGGKDRGRAVPPPLGSADTHHAFLAEEAEEALVLLRGEQQRADVGDPPRLRGLLRGAAHGRAGTALPCDRWSPRPPTPPPPPPPLRPRSQQPHRGASLSGLGKEGGGGVGGPGERPAEGAPGRRQPRRCSRWRPPLRAALNFQLRPGSGGRTIQHGSGGGRDHSARQPEGRP